MNNFLSAIYFLLEDAIQKKDHAAVSPLYKGIDLIGPYAISIVGMLSLFYGIFLGVKYAKSETADQKANAQKTLINFIIGAVVVMVLISVLYAIREPLSNWITE